MHPVNDPLPGEEQWSELALKAQGGDKASYTLLLKSLTPYIRNVLLPRLSDNNSVEDVTQEVLISVHKSLHSYSPGRPFKPWLLSIINFRLSDFLRQYYKKKNTISTDISDPVFEKNNVTEPRFAGEYKDVERALASLPDKQRTLFELMKIKGYSAKETSDITGMSVSAVKVSVHRTMTKLKEELG